jgi:hypothetical protein
VVVVEQVLAAERAPHRQRVRLGEALDIGARLSGPSASSQHHHGSLGGIEELLQPQHVVLAGMGLGDDDGPRVLGRDLPVEHVLGQRQHDGSPAARHRDRIGAGDVLGNARGVVDALDPFRQGPEHLAKVDLLERLAVAEVAAHVADEEDHRRGILESGVHADAGLRGTRPARDETEPRTAGELAVRLGHVGGARLVPTCHELHLVLHVVEAVEDRQEALARHGEGDVGALDHQLVDKNAPTVAQGRHQDRLTTMRTPWRTLGVTFAAPGSRACAAAPPARAGRPGAGCQGR